MPSLLLLSLLSAAQAAPAELGAAQAATSVLIAGFEAQDDASGELAARLPGLLQAEIGEAGGFDLLGVADVPAVGGQAATLYLEVCPPGQMEGCSYVLGGAAGVRLVLTGRVTALPPGMWEEGEEPPPPDLAVDLQILDVDAYHEALAVRLIYSEATEASFTDAVPLMLQDVVDGLVGEEVDIRRAAPEEGRGRVAVEGEEVEGMEDLDGPRSDGRLTTDPRRESRERLGLEELEAKETDKPWEPLGMTPRQYLTWWNSGWDFTSWSQRLDGRRGQLLLRLHGGFGLGPTVGHYYGWASYWGNEATPEEVYALHELVSGWGSQLGLAIGYGLTPSIEVEGGFSREGGHYSTSILMVFNPNGVQQTRQNDEDKTGTPQVWLGARWVPWPERALRPALGVGGAVWWGHAAQAEELPMSLFPAFSAPTVFSLRLAPGAELRLASRADLTLQLPLHVLLAGTSPATYDEVVLEGTPGITDKREPERAFPVAFGLQVGVQARLGGRHREREMPSEEDEEELD